MVRQIASAWNLLRAEKTGYEEILAVLDRRGTDLGSDKNICFPLQIQTVNRNCAVRAYT